ncbi:hypothetical protein OOK31_06405 [Streptomyces sp. NBC_00249]|uniref:hypothetical protein n=1 Tax=Streptomyces sp. NBC_00249 TaxID=2975690 RepID=UPI00224CD96A|nr:hypothetical protein [Streptomyces sp. NBC_00249]MCX5193525.1 hypothetical protein [Streptomyces sp. NBC_00249]
MNATQRLGLATLGALLAGGLLLAACTVPDDPHPHEGDARDATPHHPGSPRAAPASGTPDRG